MVIRKRHQIQISAPVETFDERWESANLGSYVPNDNNVAIVNADEGNWVVGDTVSSFPDCGPTPQSANIISLNSGKALSLTSVDSGSSCSDNVWLALFEVPQLQLNMGFSVIMSSNARISFDESGSLDNPQIGFPTCIVKPCGDTISLMLTDNRGNVLAYIFQRAVDAQPNGRYGTPIL